ncbi:MAG: S16 family serine protease [Ilumatobacteraceae bacterium]
MEISESNLLPPPDAEQSSVVEGVVDRTDVFPSRRHRKWAIPLAVLSCCAVVAVAVAALVPSSFIAREMNERLGELQPAPYARVPGSAQPVGDRLSVSASEESDKPPPEVFPAVGDFMLVTITEPPQSVLSWWVGRDEGAVEMLTEEDKFGFQTAEQRRVFSLEQMRTAEEVAEYVALSWLGFDAAIVPGDVLISEIACLEFSDAGECVRWPPSDEVLDPGDRLLEADGVELTSVGDLTSALEGKQPGDIITLLVERRGEGEFEADVELTSSPDDPNRTIVGFLPFDTRRVELPFDISIDTGAIGGPSAGLAFTLTVIDGLSDGELTGGKRVAVTGTIDLDGSVGAIGGLTQKASAVEQAGVELLLVPTRQGDEQIAAARAAAPDLEIVAVATLDEAIDVLVAFGGERPNPSS